MFVGKVVVFGVAFVFYQGLLLVFLHELKSNLNLSTVEPPIKRPPVIKRPVIKVPKLLSVEYFKETHINRPPPFGHPDRVTLIVFTPLKRPPKI